MELQNASPRAERPIKPPLFDWKLIAVLLTPVITLASFVALAIVDDKYSVETGGPWSGLCSLLLWASFLLLIGSIVMCTIIVRKRRGVNIATVTFVVVAAFHVATTADGISILNQAMARHEPDYNYFFKLPLPEGAAASMFHTPYHSRNDWIFAITFGNAEQCKDFCSKWKVEDIGFLGNPELSVQLERDIKNSKFLQNLLDAGWTRPSSAYHGYDGKTRTGRDATAFVDGEHMVIIIPSLAGEG